MLAGGGGILSGLEPAVYIQEQLRRVGIQIEISTFDRAFLRRKVFDEKELEAAIGTWRWYDLFDLRGKGNVTGYDNSEIFRLRDAAWETIDQDKVDEYLRQVWRIFAADMPLTYLHPVVEYTAAHRRVKGMGNNSLSDPFAGIDRLWLEDED